MTPRPRPLHQVVSRNLSRLIRESLPASLVVLQEVEITVEARFPPTVRDPDLVVVNRTVVDRNPVRVDPSDVVLVVEIVSPGSRRTDRVMKDHLILTCLTLTSVRNVTTFLKDGHVTLMSAASSGPLVTARSSSEQGSQASSVDALCGVCHSDGEWCGRRLRSWAGLAQPRRSRAL
jgi:Putative restriction endonuclease